MPLSNSRSSTFRNDSGNLIYIITTRRITSGDELKHRNGLYGFALDFRFIDAATRAGRAVPRWSDSALEAAGWQVVSKGEAAKDHDAEGDDAEKRWPKGEERRRSHLKRERHPGVARAKKAEQRRLHGRLFCEQCKMDPAEVFGWPDGEACIEVHHRGTEVANMQPGHLTKLADLECLCANCHRIRHRQMRRVAIKAPNQNAAQPLSSGM